MPYNRVSILAVSRRFQTENYVSVKCLSVDVIPRYYLNFQIDEFLKINYHLHDQLFQQFKQVYIRTRSHVKHTQKYGHKIVLKIENIMKKVVE